MPPTRWIGHGKPTCWAMRPSCATTWNGCTRDRRHRRRSNRCLLRSGTNDRQAPLRRHEKARLSGLFLASLGGGLRRLHLVRLHALRALDGDEGHLLAFLQRLEAVALDGTEVDEQVVTTFRGDEAEALGIVEPFDCTALAIRHDTYL